MPSLRAGTAKTVITPPVGYHLGQWGLRQGRSNAVHRDLFVRALVLDDGAERLAIIGVEDCGMPKDVTENIQRQIAALTGIGMPNVIINHTHNHTAPDILLGVTPEWRAYANYVVDLVAGCAYEAASAMRPAVVGHGLGSHEGWTMNRQFKDNAVDTDLGVLVVDEPDGTPVARLVNFAAHGVCDGGQYLSWSGDFAGEMSAVIEEIEQGCVAMHIQGAAGDITPFDWWFGNHQSRHLHTHKDTAEFGAALATAAITVAADVQTSGDVTLAAASSHIELPRRQVEWSVEEARELNVRLIKKMGKYSGETWPEGTTTANSAELHPEIYGSGANELFLAEAKSSPEVSIEVQALRIGDLVISAHPGEMFNELGVAIKDGHPGGNAWVASYCSEYIGYVSTRSAYSQIVGVHIDEIVDMKKFRRFYGTTTSPFAPDAGEILVQAALDVMRNV